MKTLTKLLMLCVIAGITLNSCNKDDENTDPENEPGTPVDNSIFCKINGADWTASLAVVATSDAGLLTITGSDSDSKQCAFTVHNVNGPGTYQLGGNLTNQNIGRWTIGVGQNDTYSTMLGLGEGTVNITEIDDVGFKGTFSFSAKNGTGTEVSLTEGNFEADFD